MSKVNLCVMSSPVPEPYDQMRIWNRMSIARLARSFDFWM